MLRSLVRSLFLLAALPLAAADFQFDATGVTATVTPFATTYWACACVGSVGGAGAYAFRQAIVEDTDGDGVVRWEQYNRMMHGLYTIIDGTAGTLAARRSWESADFAPLAFPERAFLRHENAYSRFAMNLYSDLPGWSSNDVFWLFWVRPGVGAWQAPIADGGSADELAGTVYEFMVHVERMQPVSDSPFAPPGVQVGDFFLLMDYEAGFWIGDRVDVHLGEASGGGVIVGATMAGHEDDGRVTINLVRIDGTDSAASLRYETVDRTATAGVHYQASSGTAVFPPGHLFASFDVPVIDDDTDSGNKLFEVKLSEPSGTTIGRDTLLAGILDNDGTPYVILPEFSAPEADGGEQEIPIPVSLNHTTRKPVTVSWEIRGAGAVQSGVLEFAPGEKQKSVAARYVADDQWSGNRSFKIVVTDAVNAERGKDGRLIILEDDPPPAMTVSEATVRESDGVAILTLQLSEALPDRADTLYHTQDGSAKGPSDYVGDTKGKSCSIAAGVTTTTITIPIEDDAIAEETETFRVQVRALGTQDYVSATVTIVDDDVAVPSRRRSIRH